MILFILLNFLKAAFRVELHKSIFPREGTLETVLLLTSEEKINSDLLGHVLIEDSNGVTQRSDFEYKGRRKNFYNFFKDIKPEPPDYECFGNSDAFFVAFIPKNCDISSKKIKLNLSLPRFNFNKSLTISINKDDKPIHCVRSIEIYLPKYFKEQINKHLKDMKKIENFLDKFMTKIREFSSSDESIRFIMYTIENFRCKYFVIYDNLNNLSIWLTSELNDKRDFYEYLRSSEYLYRMNLLCRTREEFELFRSRCFKYFEKNCEKVGLVKKKGNKSHFKFSDVSDQFLSNKNKKSTDDLENRKSTKDNRKSTDDLKNRKSMDDLENRKSTDDLKNGKSTDDLENKKSTDDLENKKSTDDLENKKSTKDNLKNRKSTKDNLKNRKSYAYKYKINPDISRKRSKRVKISGYLDESEDESVFSDEGFNIKKDKHEFQTNFENVSEDTSTKISDSEFDDFIYQKGNVNEVSEDICQESECVSELCEDSESGGEGRRRNRRDEQNETSYQYFLKCSFHKKISIILLVFFTLLGFKKLVQMFMKRNNSLN